MKKKLSISLGLVLLSLVFITSTRSEDLLLSEGPKPVEIAEAKTREGENIRFFEEGDSSRDYNIYIVSESRGKLSYVPYPGNYSSYKLNRNEKLDKKAEELSESRAFFEDTYFSAIKDILSNEEILLNSKKAVSYDNTEADPILAFEGKENGIFIKILENGDLVYSKRNKNGAFLYHILERDLEEITRLTRIYKDSLDHMLDLEVDLLRKYE